MNYYNFKEEPRIAVDIETLDPLLTKKGPGVYRKDGYVTGVSLSNGSFSEYYPFSHPDVPLDTCMQNRRYITDQLGHSNEKVFARAIYDLDWLEHFEKIPVRGTIHDIQIAEPLLDEYRRSYSVDNLAKDYLGKQKLTNVINEYAMEQGWISRGAKNGIQHQYRMPASIVAPYASEDAELTFKIFELQWTKMQEEDLMEIYGIERSLIPLLLHLRRTGVRVDEKGLTRTGIQLSDLKYEVQSTINKNAGFTVNVNSARDLERLFQQYNLPVTYGEPTDAMYAKGLTRGNPSFNKAVLKAVNHPVAQSILELRHISTLLSFYIHPYPELMVDGRLHCEFNQLRSDDFGTVSGRFSSTNPNLQQVSAKEEEDSSEGVLQGQVIRKLFIPEEDHDWVKFDYSQIEYRLIAHYATGEGAESIRRRYIDDPSTDYHEEMQEMTNLPDRKITKTMNFGTAYGMGPSKMALLYGWKEDYAEAIYRQYHDKVPFVRETSNRVASKAKRIGFIRTLYGRRARLNDKNKAYVMFNRLIQGGAADIMKVAMVECHKAGLFDVLKPHLTVHDELDVSKPRTKEGHEAVLEMKRLMESCGKLRVPLLVDCEIGPNWGTLEDYNFGGKDG